MPITKEPEDIIASREHLIYSTRKNQLSINILGWHGGRSYVDARLSRFPGESSVDWSGGTRTDGSALTGRKEQSHVVPHLNRIVNKINQQVFSTLPTRTAPLEIYQDITNDGKTIDDIMININSYLTVTGWCWLGVDAPNLDPDEQISIAQKQELKIRPYWQVYSPMQVVDWKINDNGVVEWVITEGYDYIASDPFVEAVNVKYRKLWQPGKVTKYYYSIKDKEKIDRFETINTNYNKVPFVLVGEVSAEPIAFDDMESINRTILDLESVNRANFYNCVFPQLQIPVSVLDTIVQKFQTTAENAVHMIMGLKYPILQAPNDPDAKYIMPDSSAIGSVREELKQLKAELYDSIGLLLRRDTKMVESAESKNIDLLDINALLAERAKLLEDAEKKAVKISNEWDNEFPIYEVTYNRKFNYSEDKIAVEDEQINKQIPGERVEGR